MPFITQGKTNWKFLSIVIVLAVIVGGGVFVLQYLGMPKEGVKGLEKIEKPYIKVISPNGGEQWIIGNTYEIKWDSSRVEKVKIYVGNFDSGIECVHQCSAPPGYGEFCCEPCDYQLIATDVSASLGKYSWTIPSTQIAISKAKIAIQSTATNGCPLDYGNNYFSLIKNETADWQTYRTTESEDILFREIDIPFEIKYPSDGFLPNDWSLHETPAGIYVYSFQTAMGYELGALPENEFMIVIGFPIKIPKNLDAFEWCVQQAREQYFGTAKILSKQKGNINDYEAIEIEFESKEWNVSGKYVCLQKKENLISITGGPLGSEHIKIFDQMLSTFRFIDGSSDEEEGTTCDKKCKNSGYSSGTCETYAISPQGMENKCNNRGTDIDGASDCKLSVNEEGHLIVGVGITCCCL